MLPIPHTVRLPIARGFALFLAFFTLLNLLGSLRSPGFDANQWWIDIAFLPHFAGNSALFLASLALLAFGIGLPNHWLVRRTIGITSAALAAVVFWNVLTFYGLWFLGRIKPAVPIPFSMLLGIILAFITRAAFQPWPFKTLWQRLLFIATFLLSFLLFPIAQMYCFGKTEYRRPADVIVVFGARTYSDGTASQALADRVRTAVDLYKSGLAPRLVFSGGPGDGTTSEPHAMQQLALSLGVPRSDITLDEQGLNTEASVQNTVQLLQEQHYTRLLAVSHFYHLPRVKMTYSRALNNANPPVTIYTVPAQESAPLSRMPVYILREIGALWSYYLRPLWRTP